MAAYVNRKISAVDGASPAVQLNRWSPDSNYTVALTFNGVATVDIEGTLDYINRPNPSVSWCPVVNGTGLTADACVTIQGTPLEAIRINRTAGAGTVDMHIMQGGD